ncbi:hypothetical protein Scep_012785 [Stephania cephalantha]|uniref:Uncharacterized protein n=1 Tax=Stephania cephalantha TaxID=152367 RepID=A0AAP0JG67_9MAGN
MKNSDDEKQRGTKIERRRASGGEGRARLTPNKCGVNLTGGGWVCVFNAMSSLKNLSDLR